MTGKKKDRDVATFDAHPEEAGVPGEAASDSDAAHAPKKKKLSKRELEEHLKSAEEDAAEYRANLIRLQAEFENYKKRQSREREDSRRAASEKILTEFLPVLDNLERAVDHGSFNSSLEKLLEGVKLVLKQLSETFVQFGVEPIDARGATFDPHVHEAMSTLETDGEPPDGTVVAVYQKGYLFQGRVLRPALVGVAKLVDEGDREERA